MDIGVILRLRGLWRFAEGGAVEAEVIVEVGEGNAMVNGWGRMG